MNQDQTSIEAKRPFRAVPIYLPTQSDFKKAIKKAGLDLGEVGTYIIKEWLSKHQTVEQILQWHLDQKRLDLAKNKD